jgi:hypothetical protein
MQVAFLLFGTLILLAGLYVHPSLILTVGGAALALLGILVRFEPSRRRGRP